MARRFVFLAVMGCIACADTDTDTDTDTDSDGVPEPLACEYGELAGNWVGDAVFEGGVEVLADLTAEIYPKVAQDERLAFLTREDQTINCTAELICTGSEQNEWRVALNHILPGSSGCADSWAFLRLEQDGALRLEFGQSEFGERPTFSILERAE